jgi:hypothetical protein
MKISPSAPTTMATGLDTTTLVLLGGLLVVAIAIAIYIYMDNRNIGQ